MEQWFRGEFRLSRHGRIPYRNCLIPWCSVLLEKPPIAQLLTNFSILYGIRRFVTVFTRLDPILSPFNRIHTTPSYLPKINLTLFSHLRLGLPSSLSPSGFPQNPI
jgi:hypothetical protein